MTSIELPGQRTLVANWSALAHTSAGAAVLDLPGTVAAVFPAWAPLNNAIARSGSPAIAHDTSLAALRRIYDAARVDSWAYWIPSERAVLDAPDVVHVPSLARDATTLVMHATLDGRLRRDDDARPTSVATAVAASDDAVPSSELDGPESDSGLTGWVLVRDRSAIAGLWTYVHDGDCGVYGVGTVPSWRRKGCARALVCHALCDAFEHGARTASLQSTASGVSLYESLGFEAVGRYEEWLFTSMDRPDRRGAPTTR